MAFGFLSLLPPLVAIVVAVLTRKVVLPLGLGVAVGSFILGLGRVEMQTDLGTNSQVKIRIRSDSPWVSGVHFFVRLQPVENDLKPVSVLISSLQRNEINTHEGVVCFLNTSAGSQPSVAQFIETFNNSTKNLKNCSAELISGDPNSLIRLSSKSPITLDLDASWGSFNTRDRIFFYPKSAILDGFKIFFSAVYHSIISVSHLQALVFSLLLAAMVGTLESGGGMRVLIERISKRIKTRRAAQTMIASSGLAVFFDDYANTLLLGGTMRATADRYKISREKLAYFVDSTAAPVAGIALISTWTAIEISYLSEGLANSGVDSKMQAFDLFLHSIPYRFYPWLAIVMVYCIAGLQRDFGPMHRAEHERFFVVEECEKMEKDDEFAYPAKLWLAAVIPVIVCLLTVLFVLVITGGQALKQDGLDNQQEFSMQFIGQLLGNGDSYLALIFGGAFGLLSSVILHSLMGSSVTKCVRGAIDGGKQMAPAILILWFAWALSAMTERGSLDTGGYLATLLSDQMSPKYLPTVVFVLAAITAFSTGTSWGTMGILTPLAIELSVTMSEINFDTVSSNPILLATAGSVLAGAIFGDHCSPISDTTVLSSRASGCDHLSHVKTQLPYALLVGFICVVFGTIPAAFGMSPWVCIGAGSITIFSAVRIVGKQVI